MIRTAHLSECGTYRYHLYRRWDEALRSVAFVMLNPSTADGSVDDATIRRCVGFARDWGYGTLEVVNLFAYRATDRACLREARQAGDDVIGPGNDAVIRQVVGRSAMVICAWGNNAPKDREAAILELIRGCGGRPWALAVTMQDHPAHPLRLAKTTLPFPWDRRQTPGRSFTLER